MRRIDVARNRRYRLLLLDSYAYTLTVGQDGSNRGLYLAAGSLSPATVEGTTIDFLSSEGTTISFGDIAFTQVGGWSTVTLEIEGAPEASYDLSWSGILFTASTGAAALQTYLDGIVGQDIGVNITGS